ncbi:Hypothetical protein A7982_05040 [Minicystis rosea]|nr:Hypothetical protein A7982_05040 [Minicystis rosea]
MGSEVSGARPPWDFGYMPVTPAAGPPEAAQSVVVATPTSIDPRALVEILGDGARATTVMARAPIFWTMVDLDEPKVAAAIAAELRAAGFAHRYVASAERPSLALGAPLSCRDAPVARPEAWPARARGAEPIEPASAGTWFLRDDEGGVAIDRACTGRGAGTRLAVIDDDGLMAEALDLDAEVLVDLDERPRHSTHGALMVAWASGAHGFAGVAPEASRRLYLIPKPGRSLIALPLAIARAALDGADVIVCATYVEGSTSPMLDDAIEVAARLGRRGRGAAVVLPTGREASSPPGSLHASFSLGLGEPASDPRVLCIAPGARGDGWFYWRDRRGKLRPFANRGPAVRWLAPGDDIAYPFAPARLFHAESSGASAIAAGVLLLVLANNPSLRSSELAAVLDATIAKVATSPPDREALADPADALPIASDRDGHDAKHGEGRLDAGRACLAAADPVCAALLAVGEDAAARAYVGHRRVYSRRFARWAVRALLADRDGARALRVIVRHLRLVARDPARVRAHGDGAIVRLLRLSLRRLTSARPQPGAAVRAELDRMGLRLAAIADDAEQVVRFEETLAVQAKQWLTGVAGGPSRR